MARPLPQAIRPLLRPVAQFIQREEASGIILIFCGLASLLLANSAFGEKFIGLWEKSLVIITPLFGLNKTLSHWINDGLMALFFLNVGLEIKREFISGHLSSFNKAMLPILAALGGMVGPALIYVWFNQGLPTAGGWGIPMATDIAFALAIVSLLGNRVPMGLKVFLAALAIADDLGAILVIAVFFTHEIHLAELGMAGGIFVLLVLLNLFKVNTLRLYMALGVMMWFFTLKSGVHATIAGVMLAFTIPSRIEFGRNELLQLISLRLGLLKQEAEKGNCSPRMITEELEQLAYTTSSPAQRLEEVLHPLVGFVIMPLFAVCNMAVALSPESAHLLTQPVGLGIGLGLMLGKPIGILLACALALFTGLGVMPQGVRWPHLVGAGLLAGIGFTVAMFITLLSFPGQPQVEAGAKLAILVASVLCGVLGYLILSLVSKKGKTAEASVGGATDPSRDSLAD